MDFDFNDEQQRDQGDRPRVPRLALQAPTRSASWPRPAPTTTRSGPRSRELGWPGIAIAEEHGGQGLGMVELVILARSSATRCAPSPFLSNAAAGLADRGRRQRRAEERWLPGIASGEGRGPSAALGDEHRWSPDAEGAAVIVLDDGDGPRLVERRRRRARAARR